MHGVSLIEIVADAFSITVFIFSMVMLFINNVLRHLYINTDSVRILVLLLQE